MSAVNNNTNLECLQNHHLINVWKQGLKYHSSVLTLKHDKLLVLTLKHDKLET